MAQVHVLTHPERRRRFSIGQKRAIVAAALAPGAVVADVARRADVCPSLIYRWRREIGRPDGFAEVVVAPLADARSDHSRGHGSDERGGVPAVATAEAAHSGIAEGSSVPAIEIEFSRCVAGSHSGVGAGGSGGGGDRGAAPPMIPVPGGVRVWLAVGRTDMRRGMNGLALQVQETLKRDPHGGDLYIFRGRRGDLIKILWHDGLGMSLYAKRLERGRFIWPSPADGVVSITLAQLAYLLEGIDWRNPRHSFRPERAG
ncbi:IS66 family insertion sequence element accessory protein TnpB [Defluviicoccus vanus]